MKVLVTGGLGVLGSLVTRALLQQGEEVVIGDAATDTRLLGDAASRVTVTLMDVTEPATVDEVVGAERPDVIVHLAAILTRGATADPEKAFAVNVEGSRAILRASARHGVRRVIAASSKGVYGPLLCEHGPSTYTPLPEDHGFNPQNMYDYTKIMIEGLGSHLAAQEGFEFAALRFATIFGPGRRLRHQARFEHGVMIESALAGTPFSSAGVRGAERDDLLYTGDAARALVAAAQTPTLAHAAYNIGTGTLTSLAEMADELRQIVPGTSLTVDDAISSDPPYLSRFRTDRAKEDLGFTAMTDLGSILSRYAADMAAMGLGTDVPHTHDATTGA